MAEQYPSRGVWFPGGWSGRAHVSTHQVTTRVSDLFRAAGIEHGSIHRCRHTFATQMLRNGANIRVVQTLMRALITGDYRGLLRRC